MRWKVTIQRLQWTEHEPNHIHLLSLAYTEVQNKKHDREILLQVWIQRQMSRFSVRFRQLRKKGNVNTCVKRFDFFFYAVIAAVIRSWGALPPPTDGLLQQHTAQQQQQSAAVVCDLKRVLNVYSYLTGTVLLYIFVFTYKIVFMVMMVRLLQYNGI